MMGLKKTGLINCRNVDILIRREKLIIQNCKWFFAYKGAQIMDGRNRGDIRPGIEVDIVLKKDQRSGNLTRGVVRDILTKSAYHPHGIKVRLSDGQVGRVKAIH